MDMNKELKLLLKLQKKVEGDPVQGWGGGQSGCERQIEVIVKMQKKKEEKKGWSGVLFVGGGRRMKVLVKMQEKSRRVRSWPRWM